jgi:hypothetical protein
MALGGAAASTCREAMAAATKAWLDAPANAANDIWPAREAQSVPVSKPVTIAVWESGYDASLFLGQLAFDPAESADARDNDGNGVVDDEMVRRSTRRCLQ